MKNLLRKKRLSINNEQLITNNYRYLKNGHFYPYVDKTTHHHPTLTASSGLQLGISPSSLTLLREGLQTSSSRPGGDLDPFLEK